MKTMFLRFAALICIGMISTVSLFPGGAAEKTASAQKFTARITYLVGEAKLNGEEAEIGQNVELGSSVETGRDSLCEIAFGTSNIFRIEADTLATISIGPALRNIEIKRGSIAAVFDKLVAVAGGRRDFTVVTPTVTAGIRGTVFYINVENPDSTYICTCHGTIHQEDAAGTVKKDVTSYHHKAYRYLRKAGGGAEVKPANMEFHDDGAMDALAEKIDVDIPWGVGK